MKHPTFDDTCPDCPDCMCNEPDFYISLPPGWLVVELDAVTAEIAAWPEGLRQSFEASLRPPPHGS